MSLKLNKGLLKGSLILLISFNIYNFLNFLFHLSLARMLTLVQYGILATLFSIIYFLSVFTESVQAVITKYTTKEKNPGKLKNILNKSWKKSFSVSLALFVLYSIIAIPLSYLLRIDYNLMLLNGLVIILAFLIPVTRGIMQGRKRFTSLGLSMILESFIKLGLALLFVFIGWAVYGAILGYVLGVAIAIMLSFIPLRDIIKSKEEKAHTKGIYNYTRPAFFIMLMILGFYTIDMLIAKIFFPEEIAGAYAIASILAKIIFFGTQPISRAMFPLSAESKTLDKSGNVFSNALTVLSIGIIFALTAFYFAPGFIVEIFSGKNIPEAVSILFYLGIAFSFTSLTNLVLLYKLSLGKVKGYPYLSVFLVVEVILLSIFSSNLLEFSIAFITASAAFLWGSIFLLNE